MITDSGDMDEVQERQERIKAEANWSKLMQLQTQ
jgi:hypothetical protein